MTLDSTRLTFGLWHDFRQALPHQLPHAEYYEECIEEVRHAEALGYDAVWVSEHHFVDDGYIPSVLPMLAVLARETTRMTLGSAVVLLPLHHPLRLAEDAAFVDLVSGGRFILGVGQGYVFREFQALGVDRRQRPSRMDEGIAIIKQAWETGRVTFHGKRWNFDDVIVGPRPAQQPRPPIYLGARSEAGYARVAREADGYLDPGGPQPAIKERYAAVTAARAREGKTMDGFPYVLAFSCFLDEDSDRAWEIAGPTIAYQWNKYAEWGTDPDGQAAIPVDPTRLVREDFLVGTPEEALEQLKRIYDESPFTHCCVFGRLPGLTHTQALRSLELFAQRVAAPLRQHAEGR